MDKMSSHGGKNTEKTGGQKTPKCQKGKKRICSNPRCCAQRWPAEAETSWISEHKDDPDEKKKLASQQVHALTEKVETVDRSDDKDAAHCGCFVCFVTGSLIVGWR